MYAVYFFFKTIVLNTDSVNLICSFYENKKDMLYNLKLYHLVADIFHWMWIPSWMFKGGSFCFRLPIYNHWILLPHDYFVQLECKIWWQRWKLERKLEWELKIWIAVSCSEISKEKEFFSVHKEEIGRGINFTVSLFVIQLL